ncbi:MAG: DUF934 domain-containing protein [Rhodospirillaceae bacterium]|nr:DUF934 domain-containing protein [Rhodospirillaceae bacterium]
MPALDHTGARVTSWHVAADGEPINPSTPTLVSLAHLIGMNKAVAGVLLESDADLDQAGARLANLTIAGVKFTTFKDGRPFSIARLLRTRHGFTGDLRAYGPFIPDQGAFLVRCGFSSFEVVDGFDEAALRKNIAHFSYNYQHPLSVTASIVALRQANAARP